MIDNVLNIDHLNNIRSDYESDIVLLYTSNVIVTFITVDFILYLWTFCISLFV